MKNIQNKTTTKQSVELSVLNVKSRSPISHWSFAPSISSS